MVQSSLYERIGGESAVHAAVDIFYERVVADPSLTHFFESTNMPRLKAHQAAFLSQALDGPQHYTGAYMDKAHAKLRIEQRHFDLVAAHLVETLRQLGVPEDIIGEIAAAITPLARQIVNA